MIHYLKEPSKFNCGRRPTPLSKYTDKVGDITCKTCLDAVLQISLKGTLTLGNIRAQYESRISNLSLELKEGRLENYILQEKIRELEIEVKNLKSQLNKVNISKNFNSSVNKL